MEAVDQKKLAPSISMVPIQLRSVKEEAYRPQMVTVGPYHHGNLVLLGMEEHKRHYMQTLLSRVQNPEKTLNDCDMAIINLNQRVRECYADNIHFGAAELGAILLVDGCFILELFCSHIIQQHSSNSNDPNADNAWMVPTLPHDLVLLENQIPFFILGELYNIFQKHLNILAEYSLTSLALSFFHPNVNVKQEGMSMEPNHLLDLLHKSLLPTPANDTSGSPRSNDSRGSETQGFDLCASELLEAGIQFEKFSESHLLDIKFDSGNGVIKIPPLPIHKTELVLRNLIALEHCGFNNSCKTFHISSYALLMGSLIGSLADVELLEAKGIITSNSVRGGRILGLIKDICKNVDIKHFYFGKLCKEVNAYCKSRTCRMPNIQMEAAWLLPLKEKLRRLSPMSSTPSISKVPKKLRKVDKEVYSPQMVSIGPYHHGNSDLLGMEEHKMQYMRNLLDRGENDSVETLDDCGKAIKNLDLRVRECYADKIRFESFDATKLGEILLVDGCFIIELFYRHAIQQDTNLNDPIANNAWMVSARQHDLVLLENQIPFFVLVELYNIFHPRLNISPAHSLTSLAVSFFNLNMNVRQEGMSTKPNHLLDLLHRCLLPTHGSDSSGNPPSNGSSGSETRGFDLCASELLKAGIEFKKNESHLLDIKFDGGSGVIKIPTLSVDATKSFLRNLIALEQCGFSNSCKTFHISSYALMMRSLINSSADIEILQEKGIITPDSERGGSILGLINDICKNVNIKDFYFSELCKEVNAYIKSRMPNKEMEADWLLPLKEKLRRLSPMSSTSSISKVPKKLRKVDKEAYSPQMVSIGPYHHGNSDLLGMEEHKMQFMQNLLDRGENDSVETLDDCGKAIKNLDLRVRECYADKIRFESFDATTLGEILLVDGCFIIELFYRHAIQQDTDSNDPIANKAWMVSARQHDLVLLENQIPFFILVELYNVLHRRLKLSPEHSLTSLTLSFFNLKMNVRHEGMSTKPNHLLDLLHKCLLPTPGSDSSVNPPSKDSSGSETRGFDLCASGHEGMSTEPNHLLDLLHKCLLPTPGSDSSVNPPSKDSSGSETRGFDLCASELLKAGIQFKKNESHLLDIKFDRGSGVIKIPPLSVDATKSLLRNLIALEQCGFSNSCKTFHISSYAFMMRSLIRSSADVQLLEEKGIITSDLEGSESVLDLIKDICKNVDIKHFYFRKLCKEVNAYCNCKSRMFEAMVPSCFGLKRKWV